MIHKFEKEKSYLFSELRVSFFKKKYLNVTKDSQITICSEQIVLSSESSTAAEELKPKEKELEAINGKIPAIDVNKLYICINCKGRIQNAAADNSEFMKCSSCGLSMLKVSISSIVSANIVIIYAGCREHWPVLLLSCSSQRHVRVHFNNGWL